MKSKKPSVPDAPQSSTLGQSGELGDIRVHNNVFASLVRKAALSVDGVSRLAGSTFIDGIAEFVGVRRIQDRAIAILKTEEQPDQVEIEVKIVLKHGYSIPETGLAVQKAVIEQVEAITGMSVIRVTVMVADTDDPVAEDKEAAAGDDEEVEIPLN